MFNNDYLQYEWADPPYDYASQVKLTNIKKSQGVRCTAENNIGTTSQESSIVVKSPFIVQDAPLDRK